MTFPFSPPEKIRNNASLEDTPRQILAIMVTLAEKRNGTVLRQKSLLQNRRNSLSTHDHCLKLVELFIKNCNGRSTNVMRKADFITAFSGTLIEETFCSRLFDYLVSTSYLKDEDNYIENLDANTFAKGILRFLEMDQRDRINFIIEIFDTDADGFISASELLPLVKAAFHESELETTDEHLQSALNAIVESYHKDHIDEGGLSYSAVRFIMGECLSELAGMFEKDFPLKNNLSCGKRGNSYIEVPTGRTADNLASTSHEHKSRRNWDFIKLMDEQWRFHRPRMIWLFLYVLCNVLVFEIKFLNWRLNPKYQAMRNLVGNSVCWAKGFAELSSFNCGLIFFPVCRQFVSFLRDRTPFKLWKWIPFNDNIDFHMICGHVVMVAGVGHTIAHLINFSRYSKEPNDELWYASPLNGNMTGPRPNFWDVLKTIPGSTGLIMLVIMIVAYPIVFLRRKYFNLFWYSHMLYLVWIVAFIAHGMKHMLQAPHAVWYVLPGFFIYCVERLQRFLCQATCKVKVLHAETYDNSTVLYLEKPTQNKFHFVTAGSYATINISNIALFEWHPFTISSAPGDKVLRFHIRRAGDWTAKLFDCVRQLEELHKKDGQQKTRHNTTFLHPCLSDQEVKEEEDHQNYQSKNSAILPDLKELSCVYIQGPFGAPTNDFFRYDYLVLIGLGIGVTPFASILRYFLLKWQSYCCPNCHSINQNLITQKFVQFNWLTPEVSYFFF